MKEKRKGSQRTDDLTTDEVKSCGAFSQFNDEQALEVVSMLKRFTIIMYDFFQRTQRNYLWYTPEYS